MYDSDPDSGSEPGESLAIWGNDDQSSARPAGDSPRGVPAAASFRSHG